jgi:3-oxoacyl-[acyl-carrier protein] reductase
LSITLKWCKEFYTVRHSSTQSTTFPRSFRRAILRTVFDQTFNNKQIMTAPLHNKTALVTGASRGIGAAIAHRLASEGAHVIVHYGASADAAHSVVAAIRAAGGTAEAVHADLNAPDAADSLARAVTAPTIDILVNNAGVAPFANLVETDAATFDSIININIRSLFFITQKFVSRIPDGGRIINLSSAVSRTAFPGITAYSASKGFVDVLTPATSPSTPWRRAQSTHK